MIKNINTDILITGAGPAGLMLGCQLSLHGINFLIIEKRTQRKYYSGALVIHPSSLEIFAQLNILDKVLEDATIIESINFNWSNKTILNFSNLNSNDDITKYPAIILLEQYLLEEILIERLKINAISVHEDFELIDAYETTDNITAHIIRNKYNSITVTCRYLIGADGKDSIVRHLYKFSTDKKRDKQSVFIMDFLGDLKSNPKEVNFIFNERGSFGVFPLKNGLIRLDGHIKELKLNVTETRSERVIQHLPVGLTVENTKWFSVFNSIYLLANTFRSKNCFLIGDAAHSHNPVGGQGMNSGFQDAANLAWKLAYVIKGIAHDNILNSYTIERKPAVKTIMNKSTFFFNLISQKTRLHAFIWFQAVPLIIPLFSKLIQHPKVRKYILKSTSQLWIKYTGPLIISNNKVKGLSPGTLYKNEDLPVEFRSSVNFKLIVFGNLLIHPNYWSYNPVSLDFIEIPNNSASSEIYKRLRIKTNCFILLRPDNYIAIYGEENELDLIIPYLKQLRREQNII